jgi:hypothetical protein
MKNRLFTLLLLCGFLLSAASLQAQKYKNRSSDNDDVYGSDKPAEKNKPSDSLSRRLRDRLIPGGNFDFGLSTGYSYINLSPFLAYKINEKALAGIGATYAYASFKYEPFPGVEEKYHTDFYGGRIFGEYNVYRSFWLHGEYELLNSEYYSYTFNALERSWTGNPFVGVAYRSQIGRRAYVNLTALYNLNYTNVMNRSPYSSPIVIRMGISL